MVLTLGFTILATCLTGVIAHRRESGIFEKETEVTRLQIAYRVETYANLLRGAASLFAASPDLTREQFGKYVDSLRTEEFYPGIQAVGYTTLIAPGEESSLVERMQKEGFPDFQLWPDEKLPERSATIWVAPQVMRSHSAMGFDSFSDPARREAMDEARDTGLPKATATLNLVRHLQNPPEQGFLIFVPVFRTDRIPTSIEERRATLRGFVYGAFRTRDFFEAARHRFVFPSLGVDIFDGREISPAHLIYASGLEPHSWPNLERPAEITAAGHIWTARFVGNADLGPVGANLLVPAIAGTGLVLSLILFAATSRLAKARAEAEQSAEDAAHNQRLFERIAAASPDVLYLYDLVQQRILYVNREIHKSLGYSPEEIRAMGTEVMSTIIHPDDRRAARRPMNLDSLPEGEVFSREMRILHANGGYRWFLTRSVVFFPVTQRPGQSRPRLGHRHHRASQDRARPPRGQ